MFLLILALGQEEGLHLVILGRKRQITDVEKHVLCILQLNCGMSFIILLDLVCHETPAPPPCNYPLACLSPRSANQILKALANHVRLANS